MNFLKKNLRNLIGTLLKVGDNDFGAANNFEKNPIRSNILIVINRSATKMTVHLATTTSYSQFEVVNKILFLYLCIFF